MIVDTNVLLRILDGADGAESQAARARVAVAREHGERLSVLAATVLEVAYVLESAQAGYGWDRSAVTRAVTAVVDEPGFDVEHGGALRAATAAYQERAVDLHDCLLDAIARERKTRVLSFDADLRRLGTGERP